MALVPATLLEAGPDDGRSIRVDKDARIFQFHRRSQVLSIDQPPQPDEIVNYVLMISSASGQLVAIHPTLAAWMGKA
jgi:hypothetical protein